MAIKAEVIEQLGNKLTADFKGEYPDLTVATIYSPLFVIGGLVSVKLKAIIYSSHIKSNIYNRENYNIYVQFQNYQNNTLRFECKVYKGDSDEPVLVSQDSNWNELQSGSYYAKYGADPLNVRRTFVIGLMPSSSLKFSCLYDDEDLADFKLCAEDGTITVHRSVLAAHSPVLKSMFTGSWKETKEGRVNVTGTSAKTLEHLKKYMYLDQLPDTNNDLEPLLVLSNIYMMKDLAQKCSAKILFNLTPENTVHYLQLACQYKLKILLCGIITGGSAININTLTASCDDEKWL